MWSQPKPDVWLIVNFFFYIKKNRHYLHASNSYDQMLLIYLYYWEALGRISPAAASRRPWLAHWHESKTSAASWADPAKNGSELDADFAWTWPDQMMDNSIPSLMDSRHNWLFCTFSLTWPAAGWNCPPLYILLLLHFKILLAIFLTQCTFYYQC